MMRNPVHRSTRLSPQQGQLLEAALAREGIQRPKARAIEVRRDLQRLPLSFAQQRLWFLHQLDHSGEAYHLSSALRLDGALDLGALRGAFRALEARHEVLRTCYPAADGVPEQRIIAAPLNIVPVIDLTTLPQDIREAIGKRIYNLLCKRAFNLSDGPVWRAVIVRCAIAQHVLALVLHHIASDGWSMALLINEMTVAYDAICHARPAPFRPLPVQYADFAVWQRNWMDGDQLERQLAYWRKQLAALEPTELPTDRPRATVRNHRGAQIVFAFDGKVSADIAGLASREGATPFMVLLAAWFALTYRWTAQRSVSISTEVANRPRPELEGLIGLFVNQLVIRADVGDGPTFRVLLARVREATLGAYAHQDLPFERVVDELAPGRDVSRAPLAQIKLVFQALPNTSSPIVSSGLATSTWGSRGVAVNEDICITIGEEQGAFVASVDYAADLFERASIERLLDQWRLLVEHMVRTPEARIEDVSILSTEARSHLVASWDTTTRDRGTFVSVDQLVAQHAAATPRARAVVCRTGNLTYMTLDRRATQLAHRLRELGVKRDVSVAICMPRAADFVVALLAVLRAGGVYVPVNPDLPHDRINFLIADTRAQVVITTKALRSLTRNTAATLVCLDQDAVWLESLPTESLVGSHDEADLAYIIYTSGSTGEPKGVMIPHRGLWNHLQAKIEDLALNSSDVIIQNASCSFDISVWQFLAPLAVGGTVCVVDDEIATDAWMLVEEADRVGATVLELVPAQLGALVDALSRLEAGRPALTSLRFLLATGEAFPSVLHRRWQKLYPHVTVVNAYGPTECADDVTHHHVVSPPLATIVPLGRPLRGTRLYVVDHAGDLAPLGAIGELYVGGEGLARGYRGQPQLTAERFLPDPFGGDGERLYRTGDRVRANTEGALEYLGRLDHQVKIRGYRIELAEIESVLNAHDAVQQAAVLSRVNDAGVPELAGYWVSALRIDESTIREYLRQKLPEYMLPRVLVRLDALPLTENGKIDRAALAAIRALPAVAPSRAPRTKTEELLCEIWAQVLRRPSVSIDDNFFDLGGDSILSIQIIARARQAGLKFTVRQIFTHQTVAELAAVADSVLPITTEQGPVSGPVPLTPIQHALLQEDRIDLSHYNQSVMLTLQRPLARKALAIAFEEIVRHHDALRLQVQRTEAGWVQTNAEQSTATPFTDIDLSEVLHGSQHHVVTRIANYVQRSLSLSRGPLLRAVRMHLGEHTPDRLLVVIHHWAIDGVSWRILLEDVERCCAQFERGEPIRLPPKSSSFQQWAAALVAYAQSETIRKQADYWRTLLATQSSRLPRDLSRQPNTIESGESIRVELTERDTTTLLEQLPRLHRVEVQDALLMAISAAVTRATGTKIALIDLEGHGREEIAPDLDVSRTVGWFTTRYPVALSIEPTASVAARLQSVREQLAEIPDHGIGYGLCRFLMAAPGLSEPEPEISFNYLGQLDLALGDAFGLAPESSGAIQGAREPRRYLIEINAQVVNGRLQCAWQFSRAVHTRDTVTAWSNVFIEELRRVVASCAALAEETVLAADFPDAELSEAELKRLLTRVRGRN